MRKILSLVLLLSFLGSSAASAHQPVLLTNQDTSAAKGPLLVDGTVSFAIRASFTKAKEIRAFRAQLKTGDMLEVQYLIFDKAPDNKLKVAELPTLVITSPSGVRENVKLNERTKFYEPYSKTKYLYLGRISKAAEAGVYTFVITSKARAAVTIAVGDREVSGDVVRGALPAVTEAPTPTPTPTPKVSEAAVPVPSPSSNDSSSLTPARVALNNKSSSCWSIIDEKVYDLTRWIDSHPGGPYAIEFLCGKDGSNSFKAQHAGRANPIARLADYLLGPVVR